ncbi:MAG: winged helix-turn-helix domain-containing protein [Acetobacteraceae bacterium]|nr:winged helix-turn-helix domain-containing protein [Acetobacteraceae bacterium]
MTPSERIAQPRASPPLYRFAAFALDVERGSLVDAAGNRTELRPKSAEVLRFLAENAGHVVSRDALMSAVWPNVFVTDDSITQCITEIRRALGVEAARLLRTFPRRGYLLDAQVARQEVHVSASPAAQDMESGGRALAGMAASSIGDDRPSIAVLPFRCLPGDAQQSWFAEGIIEGIIHVLSGIENLFVIAQGSSLSYAGTDPDPRRVADELGVRYVLRGAVQRSEERLRITAQLIDAVDGRVLRAEKCDGAATDLFEMQDRIAAQVIAAIAPTVHEQELQRAMRKPPSSLTAYDLVLRALDLMPRLDSGLYEQAGELLKQAIALDPGYAPARSYAALWHLIRIAQGWTLDPAEDSGAAARNAAAALEREHYNATALAIQGHMLSYTRREFAAAARLLERATVAGPSNPTAWAFRSATTGYLGDGPRAVEQAEHAIRLSPLDPFVYLSEHLLSQAHYIAGNYAEAVRWGRWVAQQNPRHAANLRTLTASLAASGDVEGARETARQLLALNPGFRLSRFAARTPLGGSVLEQFLARLRAAGLPD